MQSLEREKQMIEVVNRGLGAFEPLGREADFTPPGDLRPEQAEAIRFVLASRDRAVAISGAAGTGKTATLRELRSALARAGHDVCAVAPTMSAVEELQKVGFAETVTLARLLTDPNLQNAMRGRVIISMRPAWCRRGRWPSSYNSPRLVRRE